MSIFTNVTYSYTLRVCMYRIHNMIRLLCTKVKVYKKNLNQASGFTGGFLLLHNFSVAISVSPHVCFILVLILISMFLR